MGDNYSDDDFDDEDEVPARKPAPPTSQKKAVPTPTPPSQKRQPGGYAAPSPRAQQSRPRVPNSARVANPQRSPKGVARVLSTPPQAAERVESDRIIDADGKSIPLESPRLKAALVTSGVLLPEIFSVPKDKFIDEAVASGLPEETGERRYMAFEISRQSAVQELLSTRKAAVHDKAASKWKGAGDKLHVIRQMFDIIDEDRSGTLEMAEFKIMVKTLGLPLRPDEIEKAFKEIDEDKGGTIDFEEFQGFYFAATEKGTGNTGKRLGKEMLANLHANLFNASIQEAKGKMGMQMLKERKRYKEAVQRLEDSEKRKREAHETVERLNAEYARQKQAKEKETIAVYEAAVSASFQRKVVKEEQAAEAVEKARRDLQQQLREDEAEQARRKRNFAEDQHRALAGNRLHNEKLARKKGELERAKRKDAERRAARLVEVQEEEAARLRRVEERSRAIAQRNMEKSVRRRERLEQLRTREAKSVSVAAEQFEEKIKSLDERMKYWEEDRQALSARRAADFQGKQAEIKVLEAAEEEKRLNLAWKMQGNMEEAEKRRLRDLALKAEESKLWLQTRMAKLNRAQRRKELRLQQQKEELEDKHSKMDAMLTQRAEFDRKRKQLAQDALTAKLKMKHQQERDFFLLQQGKKVVKKDLPDKVMEEFEQLAAEEEAKQRIAETKAKQNVLGAFALK